MHHVGKNLHHTSLSDAISILALNNQQPSHLPTVLEQLSNLEKNKVNDKISVIHDTLGIERATPSLLDRMCKSTIGFSEHGRKKSAF